MPLRGLCRKVRIGSFQHFFLTIFQTTNLTPYLLIVRNPAYKSNVYINIISSKLDFCIMSRSKIACSLFSLAYIAVMAIDNASC